MSMLSAHLLAQIEQRLRTHGIRHATLREGPPHLNLNAHDAHRVFVKVSRTGEQHGRAARELTGATWATAHGLAAPTPLIPEVLDLHDEHDHPRDVTVWGWLTGVTAPALVDQARLSPRLLATIATLPAPADTPTFDLDFFYTRILDRLRGRIDPPARSILATAEAAAATITDRLDPGRYVWLHGDLHADNLLWQVNGQPVVLDWESHTHGPIEWDVAQMLRSVVVNFPRHMACDKEHATRLIAIGCETLLAAAGIDIDWPLVLACGRFRAASSASHLLVHGHHPDRLAADLSLIEQHPFLSAADSTPTVRATVRAA